MRRSSSRPVSIEPLAYGRSVQTAFDLGANLIALQGLPDEATPHLVATKVECRRRHVRHGRLRPAADAGRRAWPASRESP